MNALEKFDAAVAAYLKNAKYTRTAEKTLDNYTRRLGHFRDFWTTNGTTVPQHDPTYADVEAWRDALMDRGLKASTVKQYLSELGFFFTKMSKPIFGAELRYAENPVCDEFFPSVEKRPYDVILTDEQTGKLLPNVPTSAQATHFWPRNYAIVTLLLTTKIRNAELLSLRLCDLDFEDEVLTVERGKGSKFRTVEFPALARSAVMLYLQSGLRPAPIPDTAPLFGTTAGNEYGAFTDDSAWHAGSSQWLSSLVERHVFACCGVHDVRTHDLRHVGARLNLNAGASMEFIQSELGHASMNTTQIYSGRLTQRKGRNSARELAQEMERQAVKNFARVRNAARIVPMTA